MSNYWFWFVVCTVAALAFWAKTAIGLASGRINLKWDVVNRVSNPFAYWCMMVFSLLFALATTGVLIYAIITGHFPQPSR